MSGDLLTAKKVRTSVVDVTCESLVFGWARHTSGREAVSERLHFFHPGTTTHVQLIQHAPLFPLLVYSLSLFPYL